MAEKTPGIKGRMISEAGRQEPRRKKAEEDKSYENFSCGQRKIRKYPASLSVLPLTNDPYSWTQEFIPNM